MTRPVALTDRLVLHPAVSLRPERFGALAYSFDTRRLSFLKHPDLVRVVEALDGERSVGECLVDAGVDETRWDSFLRALGSLRDSHMLADAGGDRAA